MARPEPSHVPLSLSRSPPTIAAPVMEMMAMGATDRRRLSPPLGGPVEPWKG